MYVLLIMVVIGACSQINVNRVVGFAVLGEFVLLEHVCVLL